MSLRLYLDANAGALVFRDGGSPLTHAEGIKRIRAARGWNTKAMGEALGVSSRTVEGWEQGRPIECTILLRIARVMREKRF